MPGYGISAAQDGLLEWAWAVERLASSHDFWLATVRPDGRPHVMPVWAVWRGDALWFTTAAGSIKARNLAGEPRCTLTTDDALEPVVLEGRATQVTDPVATAAFLAASNEKYGLDRGLDFVDPAVNHIFRVAPDVVFALTEADPTGSPTRWHFD